MRVSSILDRVGVGSWVEVNVFFPDFDTFVIAASLDAIRCLVTVTLDCNYLKVRIGKIAIDSPLNLAAFFVANFNLFSNSQGAVRLNRDVALKVLDGF